MIVEATDDILHRQRREYKILYLFIFHIFKDNPKTNACYSQAVTYDKVLSDLKKCDALLGMNY